MAKVTQVVLMACKTFTDNRRKFKQNVPVTMTDPADIAHYRANAMFSIREVEESRKDVGVSAPRANPGDPFVAAVDEETTRVPQRKKKTGKKLKPKHEE